MPDSIEDVVIPGVRTTARCGSAEYIPNNGSDQVRKTH